MLYFFASLDFFFSLGCGQSHSFSFSAFFGFFLSFSVGLCKGVWTIGEYILIGGSEE